METMGLLVLTGKIYVGSRGQETGNLFGVALFVAIPILISRIIRYTSS